MSKCQPGSSSQQRTGISPLVRTNHNTTGAAVAVDVGRADAATVACRVAGLAHVVSVHLAALATGVAPLRSALTMIKQSLQFWWSFIG
jgi:hypothetical protein